ncbi:MAG: HEPN domain-containing protein [Pseudomonadota bacterium]
MLVRLAEQDWEIVVLLNDATHIGVSGMCFHAQQCIEKYLKALLLAQGEALDRTHNLPALAVRLGDRVGPWPVTLDDLALVNPCAVVFRYDDSDLEVIDKGQAFELTRKVRDWAADILASRLRKA